MLCIIFIELYILFFALYSNQCIIRNKIYAFLTPLDFSLANMAYLFGSIILLLTYFYIVFLKGNKYIVSEKYVSACFISTHNLH